MRMYDIIKKKRDGFALDEAEIRFFIKGYVSGEIPDYQAAALCMAIYYQGMDAEETTALTLAIRDSGDKLDCSDINGIRVDKHSTGGVGDKTSLIVCPIVAACGIKVAKMSGRGLGHTGGTVDKLESIPGFRTDLPTEEFKRIVNDIGIAIVGQSRDLAPADKLLYALRDVTATVDSMPLIASSIMGKKLCADDDCIVLDVKTGSGSFMKTDEASLALARLMVDIGKRAGKKMLALVTDMDRPLGSAIGNALEVKEAIATLDGQREGADLTEISVILATNMLYLAEKGSLSECEKIVLDAINSKKALKVLCEMIRAQGGDEKVVLDPSKLPEADYSQPVVAPVSGFITAVDTEKYGLAALTLGAGRNTMKDVIDPSAGIYLYKKTGDYVKEGDPLAVLYTCKKESLAIAEKIFLDATVIGDTAPQERPLVIYRVE